MLLKLNFSYLLQKVKSIAYPTRYHQINLWGISLITIGTQVSILLHSRSLWLSYHIGGYKTWKSDVNTSIWLLLVAIIAVVNC